MEIITTRRKLIAAMQAYNAETLANPDNYGEIEDDIYCAIEQVDELLKHLDK